MNNHSDPSQTKAPSITFSVRLATLLILGVASLTTVEMEKARTEVLGGTYTKKSREPSNKNDASRQGEFLLQKAFASGFDSVESWMLSGPKGIKEFTAAAQEWRAGERLSASADPEADAISNPALRERLEKYQFGRACIGPAPRGRTRCRGRSSGGRDLRETELRPSGGLHHFILPVGGNCGLPSNDDIARINLSNQQL